MITAITEIRIYYESYEQAKHFVSKLISDVSKDIPIILVRKKGGINAYKHYSRYVAPIIFWKDQDILVTVISQDKEIPILAIEFSSAVFTEDHELQRSDSMASALESGCVYIKYSSLKRESISDHGGNKDYNYTIPYRVMFQRNRVLAFHVEWDLSGDGSGYLESNNTYLACPPDNDYIQEIFSEIFNYVTTSFFFDEKWAQYFTEKVFTSQHSKEMTTWLEILQKPVSLEELGVTESSRTSVHDGTLYLKFNRFGHSMDPERGMLCYYSNVFPNIVSSMVLHDSNPAWFKDTPNENTVDKYIANKGLKTSNDFKNVLIYASSLNRYEYFKDLYDQTTQGDLVQYDITDFVETNYYNVNKALRMIFRYSDSFVALDNERRERCVFSWNRNKIDFQKNIASNLDITEIVEKESFEEDEVTYIVAHEILEKNDFKLVSISYPGSQGDKAILPNSGGGRKQNRIYIDTIAYLPDYFTDLNECKGSFDVHGITSDIEKLVKFRTNKSYSNALKNLLERIAPDSANLPILLSVSFWENPIGEINHLPISELDFFIVISNDRSRWKIFHSGNKCKFKKTEGFISLDKTYKVK